MQDGHHCDAHEIVNGVGCIEGLAAAWSIGFPYVRHCIAGLLPGKGPYDRLSFSLDQAGSWIFDAVSGIHVVAVADTAGDSSVAGFRENQGKGERRICLRVGL